MKPILLAIISFLFLGVFLNPAHAEDQAGGQQVMKELDEFQRALSNWMKNFETIGSQVSALQKSVSESLTPLKDFEKTARGIDDRLNSIITRMENVEKTSSVAEVKAALDSFNKTFDVLKKLLSDLTKRVEDQEIKTTVLEKRYQEAQRPLEPIKKAIEDLSKLVSEKVGEQDKKIAVVEDGNKTRLTSLDATVKTIDEKLKSLYEMDARVRKLERGGAIGTAGTATTIAAVAPAAPSGTPAPPQTKVAAESETAKKPEAVAETAEEAKERVPTPEEEGFKEIGDGFYMRNVNLTLFGSSSQIKGEIKNMSDRDRSIAMFVVRVYNAADTVLFTQDFSIKTFKKGEVRTFNEIISGYTPIEIARYQIEPKRRY